MEEQIEEQMAQIVAEEATLQDQDSNLEETMEDEEFEEASEDDEDMDDDDQNAASYLEVSLDPQQYERSSDTQEGDGGSDEDDNCCQTCGEHLDDHPNNLPCNVNEIEALPNSKFEKTKHKNQPQSNIENVCPICERSLGTDEKSIASHLCSHFTAELAEVYEDLKQCSKCKFGSDLRDSISGQTRAKMLAAHHAADHGNGEELLEFLKDKQLVRLKRDQHLSKVTAKNGMSNGSIGATNTIRLGKHCPICDQSLPGAAIGGSGGQAAGRTHVADHFLAEMRELMPHSGTSCPECPFVSDRTDIAARHLALAHHKLDAILQNREAVNLKRKDYKMVQIGVYY